MGKLEICIQDKDYQEVIQKLNGKIYFISNYDGEVHNIGDRDHMIVFEEGRNPYVEVGEWCGDDGLRIDDICDLWTIKEIVEIVDILK